MYANLREVAKDHSAETERRAGELEAQLRFGRIEDIVRDGLHNYVVRLLARVQDLGNRIADDFLVPLS